MDLAVRKARQAFDDGRWAKMAPADRKEVLIRLVKLMTRNRRELAVMESIESGKPIRDCDSIDVPEAIDTIKWHAELIDKVYDKSAPVGDDAMAIIVREPVGVVGAVLPWNFPLLIAAWKIGPALAAGNSVVLKPSKQTSLTALRLAELAMEAGLPDGVLNVVTGTGSGVGEPIATHMDIDMVTFTGSTETGRQFLRYSADSNLKKVTLECGGKNPFVVLEGAEDLDMVAEHFVTGAFWNMGENCSASSRLIVHRAVRDELLDRVLARAADWRTGDPLDPVNQLGPLVDEPHHRKVCSYLRAGADEGAGVLLGGRSLGGLYVEPTIFDVNDSDSVLIREEIFGPVAAVTTVTSNEAAVRMANNTPYGLAASVFSGNMREALRGARISGRAPSPSTATARVTSPPRSAVTSSPGSAAGTTPCTPTSSTPNSRPSGSTSATGYWKSRSTDRGRGHGFSRGRIHRLVGWSVHSCIPSPSGGSRYVSGRASRLCITRAWLLLLLTSGGLQCLGVSAPWALSRNEETRAGRDGLEISTSATNGAVPRTPRPAGREDADGDRGRSGDGDVVAHAGGCADRSSGAAHRTEVVRAVSQIGAAHLA